MNLARSMKARRGIRSALRLIFAISLAVLFSSCRISTEPQVSSPTIVFTFDDQHQSIYDVALPLMQKYGFRGTNFVNTAKMGNPDLMNWDECVELELIHGWETGGHTLYHDQLNLLELEEAKDNISQDFQNLKERGLNPKSFALPKGQCPYQLYEHVQSLYENIRGSSDFAMHKPFNRYGLGYLAYQTGWTAKQVKARILRGVMDGEDLIIIGFHRFDTDSPIDPDICKSEDFEEILRFVSEKDYQVLPLKEVF